MFLPNKVSFQESRIKPETKRASFIPYCSASSMEDNFFVASNFLAKGKDPDCEDTNLSLDLCLSIGNTTKSTTTSTDQKEKLEVNQRESNLMFMEINKSSTDSDISLELCLFPCDHSVSTYTTTTDRKGKQPIMSMENSCSGLFSSEPSDSHIDTDSDISLALSLSLNQRFEVGESSKRHDSKPTDASTTKKRKTMVNHPIANRRYKRSKVEIVSTELRLALDPWSIKKKLFKSDIGGNARLMLASDLVEAHVLRYWSADQVARIEEGVSVLVWDCDTNSEHMMKFRRWNSNANVLMKKWVSDFVKRRQLMQGDEIGLYWDTQTSRFNFSVLSRAPRQ